ncbi:MAG TPA: CvpA family protein, partial [Acidimicrobiales bacterium]
MHFDLLDVIIAAVAVSAAVGGFRLGFLARVASWIGLAAGLLIGARLLPTVVTALRNADPTGKLLVAALVLLGGAFLGQAIGLVIGWRAHRFIPFGPLRTVDDAVGAAVGLLGVLVAVWLLLPSMADVAGWPARQARNSSVARFVDREFPRPPDTLQALRRLVGSQAFPEVFNALAPSVNAGPPPAASPLAAPLVARIEQSTVKVEGQTCGQIQEGSGWAVGADTIVTNAHVVAGERHTEVLTPAGRLLPARVTAFDESRDLAVLAVPGLADRPLPVFTGPATTPEAGKSGDVFGHPGGQDPVAV